MYDSQEEDPKRRKGWFIIAGGGFEFLRFNKALRQQQETRRTPEEKTQFAAKAAKVKRISFPI